jgi:hypothetical protein
MAKAKSVQDLLRQANARGSRSGAVAKPAPAPKTTPTAPAVKTKPKSGAVAKQVATQVKASSRRRRPGLGQGDRRGSYGQLGHGSEPGA